MTWFNILLVYTGVNFFKYDSIFKKDGINIPQKFVKLFMTGLV